MRILVADDTKNIRVLLTNCLEIEGYEVVTANDGQQALALFKLDKFDLAFLDIKMPEMSGTEVLKKVRELGINTPVIIITAFATVKNAVECTKLGAVSYLQKPFTAEKVRTVLSKLYNQDLRNAHPENLLNQAENLINHGSFEEANVILKKAISLDPTNAELFLLFSKAYKGIGNHELEEKFYQTYQLFNNLNR
ncbi:MAG: response regulator [Deltaproteobacteria bacterium]